MNGYSNPIVPDSLGEAMVQFFGHGDVAREGRAAEHAQIDVDDHVADRAQPPSRVALSINSPRKVRPTVSRAFGA